MTLTLGGLGPIMSRLTGPHGSAQAHPGRNGPYVGPQPFQPLDRGRFFGREREVRELTTLARARGFVVLFSTSGLGKSSLLSAGVGPQLADEGALVLPAARVRARERDGLGFSAKPDDGNLFVYNLLTSIAEHAAEFATVDDAYRQALLEAGKDIQPQTTLADFFIRLREGIDSVDRSRRAAPSQDASSAHGDAGSDDEDLYEGGTRRPIVLFIDQFEEICTHHPEFWQHRGDFFKQIAAALRGSTYSKESDSDSYPPIIVLAIREDFLGSLRPFRNWLPDLERNTYRLEGLSPTAAESAILSPLRPGDMEEGFAAELVKMLREAKSESTSEPFLAEYVEPVQLQVICLKLWEHAQKRSEGQRAISPSDLTEIGGISGILSRFYDEEIAEVVKQGLASEQHVRTWFDKNLILSGNYRRPIFAPSGAREVEGLGMEAVKSLMEGYVLHSEPLRNGLLYEITHDRLVGPIHGSNERWNENRLRLRFNRTLWIAGILVIVALGAVLGLQQEYARVAKWHREAQAIEDRLRRSPRTEFKRLADNYSAVADKTGAGATSSHPWVWKAASRFAVLAGAPKSEVDRVARRSPRSLVFEPFARVALRAPELRGILAHDSTVLATYATMDALFTLTSGGRLHRRTLQNGEPDTAAETVLEDATLGEARAVSVAYTDSRLLLAALDHRGQIAIRTFGGKEDPGAVWSDPGLPPGLFPTTLALSPDATRLALGTRCAGGDVPECTGSAVLVVDLEDAKPAGDWRWIATSHLGGVSALAFSDDASTLVAGGCSPTPAIGDPDPKATPTPGDCFQGLIAVIQLPTNRDRGPDRYELEVGEPHIQGLALLRNAKREPMILIDGGQETVRLCNGKRASIAANVYRQDPEQMVPSCGSLRANAPAASAPSVSPSAGEVDLPRQDGSAMAASSSEPFLDEPRDSSGSHRMSTGAGRGTGRCNGTQSNFTASWVQRARLLRIPFPFRGSSPPETPSSSTLSLTSGGLVIASRGSHAFLWQLGAEPAGSRLLKGYEVLSIGDTLARVAVSRDMTTIATVDARDQSKVLYCSSSQEQEPPCEEGVLQDKTTATRQGRSLPPLALNADARLVASWDGWRTLHPPGAGNVAGKDSADGSERRSENNFTAVTFDRLAHAFAYGTESGDIGVRWLSGDRPAEPRGFVSIQEPLTCDPTEEPLPNLNWFRGIKDLSFNAKGDLLAAIDSKRCIRLFQMPDASASGASNPGAGNAKPRLAAAKQTGAPLFRLAFSNGGAMLAAGGWDGKLALVKIPESTPSTGSTWPLPEPETIAFGDRSDQLPLNTLVFTHDDSLVATVDMAGRAFFWNIDHESVKDSTLIDSEIFLHNVATSDVAMACYQDRPMIVSSGIDTVIENGVLKTIASIRAFDLSFEDSVRRLYRLSDNVIDDANLRKLRELGKKICDQFLSL